MITKTDKQISVLCRNCTNVKDCLKDRLTALFIARTTYCTRFDNKDKSPRLFPFLQPYEVDYMDAEFNFNKRKKFGEQKVTESKYNKAQDISITRAYVHRN